MKMKEEEGLWIIFFCWQKFFNKSFLIYFSSLKKKKETSDGDVSKFYDGTVVLITGGTGFLGKVLVEKLLRIFRVKKIYLLIRIKNNMNVEDRLEHFFKETVGIFKKGLNEKNIIKIYCRYLIDYGQNHQICLKRSLQ